MNYMDDGEDRRKRQRDTPINMEDLMRQARIIWRRKNPDQVQAASTEDRMCKEHFGCSAEVAMITWDFLAAYDYLPPNATIEHFLWALMFLKIYAKTGPMRSLCGGADSETIMKHVWEFVYGIARMEQYLIDWDNRFKGDRACDCLVSIDGTDVKCPNYGPPFSTYKHGKKGGLRYEVGLCIQTGDIVWLHGPFPAGEYNDVTIFRSAVKSHLEEGERVEADDGYIGESPQCVKCPKSFTNPEETLYMQQRVRNRQESVNNRFKFWNVLAVIFRHEIHHHGYCIRAVAVITQIAINNGAILFQTGYKDPPFVASGTIPLNTGYQRAQAAEAEAARAAAGAAPMDQS